MFYIQLKTLYYILLLVCFEPSISNKIREDANYKQEFVRIYDQSLSAIIVIDGDIDDIVMLAKKRVEVYRYQSLLGISRGARTLISDEGKSDNDNDMNIFFSHNFYF